MSHLLIAVDATFGIAKLGKLPWARTAFGKADMAMFKEKTLTNAVIMGYTTFLSIGAKPLKGRLNIVVTKNHYDELIAQDWDPAQLRAHTTLNQAILDGKRFEKEQNKPCFVIGGGSVYKQYLEQWRPKTILYSKAETSFDCDEFAPDIIRPFLNNVGVDQAWVNELDDKEEQMYLDSLHLLLNNGHQKSDRTGTGTLSYFSPPPLEFNLLDNRIPVLTTKRVALKTGVIPELLWFMKGHTDTTLLEAQKCMIWKGNTTRDFLDKRGLHHYKTGDMGPGYGFQWRHSGATYNGCDDDYTGQGVDQLQGLVELLRTDPDSRRMVMTAWVPPALHQMALPPCHILYQVYTRLDKSDGKRYLTGKMYQRSADSFLGVPFNIASYAILTHLLAQLTGCIAERLVMTFGDYHLYLNHKSQVKEQLSRKPLTFPKIAFKRDLFGLSVDDITENDFEITGYHPHPAIKAPMAV